MASVVTCHLSETRQSAAGACGQVVPRSPDNLAESYAREPDELSLPRFRHDYSRPGHQLYCASGRAFHHLSEDRGEPLFDRISRCHRRLCVTRVGPTHRRRFAGCVFLRRRNRPKQLPRSQKPRQVGAPCSLAVASLARGGRCLPCTLRRAKGFQLAFGSSVSVDMIDCPL
jgi:hypothetical protein